MPRFAARWPSPADQLSLLRCVLHLCRLPLFAGCFSSGADGCVFRLRSCSSLLFVSRMSSFLVTGAESTGAAGRDSRPRLSMSSALPFPRSLLPLLPTIRGFMRTSTYWVFRSKGTFKGVFVLGTVFEICLVTLNSFHYKGMLR